MIYKIRPERGKPPRGNAVAPKRKIQADCTMKSPFSQVETNGDLVRTLTNGELAGIIECPATFAGGLPGCEFSEGGTIVECLECKKKWLGEEALICP